MRPILFSIFGIPFASWYVFFALAAVSAFFYSVFLLSRARNRLAFASLPTLFTVCYLGGWFGARALSILVEQFEVRTIGDFFIQLFQLGPMTFYGGALLSFAVGLTYVLVNRRPVGLLADAVLPAGVLALGVGRVGCYLNGDDYGRPLPAELLSNGTPWWGVSFPNLADLEGAAQVVRYPVQLQEALVCFAIALLAAVLFLLRYSAQKLQFLAAGHIACFAAFLSAFNRFFNENYRGDTRGNFLLSSFSTSQGIALVIMFAAVLGFCFCFYKKEPRT